MRELSLNILDIAQNSVVANAKNIAISIVAKGGLLTISIADDGCGMDAKFLKNVIDPFTTTRTTRKVGMGIPLFKMSAESSGGKFSIQSKKGVGTTTTASFQIAHIDRMPLGDVPATICSLITTAPSIDYQFDYTVEDNSFSFNTKEVKEIMAGIPIQSYEVVSYINEFLTSNILEINGGILL